MNEPAGALATPLTPLAGTIARSFEGGVYTSEVLKSGTLLYRVENVGDFFGFTKPANKVWAEAMYNVEVWGNRAEEVATYQVLRDVTMYLGPVAGGIAEQVLVPRALKVLDYVQELTRSALK